MSQKFARHKLTIDANTLANPQIEVFYFLSPEDTYDGLAESATGVDKIDIVAAADTYDERAPLTSVESLLKSGAAVRKVVKYTTGTGASLRTRYAKIIVAANRAAAFAPSGSFRGGTIKGVVNPLDASFS